MRLELHPETRAELRRAAIWYEQKRPGLGDEFIIEVSSILERFRSAPESYPVWPGTQSGRRVIRRVTLRRFPYVIAIEMQERDFIVLAIAHAKRRPLYWLTRTKS